MMSVAAEPTPLLVGAVRDGDGRPIAGAAIRALTADGSAVGIASSDAAGTFAVTVERPAAMVEVKCPYCPTRRISLTLDKPDEPLVVIVPRYHALSDNGPSQRDLQVLPYRRPSEAVGLFPFLVPARAYPLYGDSLSDRGLDLGYALVLDQGAPTYDLTGQTTAFTTVPDRSVQRVDVAPASFAYRYGSYAGGGTFVLDSRGEAPDALGFESGQNGSLAGYSRFGGFTPSAAESLDQDDGAARRRAGLDYETAFAGGILRVDAAAQSQTPLYESAATALNDSILHAAYATASRRYRTFGDLSLTEMNLQDSPATGNSSSGSSAVVANVRVEHPATILTAFGVTGQHYTGSYNAPNALWPLNGLLSDYSAYAEARGGGSRASFDAAASLQQIAVQTNENGTRSDFPLTAVLPSVSGHYDLGGGFSLKASASSSFRAATLTELAVETPYNRDAFERGALFEGGIQFDDSQRVRLEAMAFRESLKGFVDRSTVGIGASVTWQVAPLLSLRAWSLHDAADQTSVPLVYVPTAPLALSRSVLWATYDNPSGLRLDTILHRDLSRGPAETDLDGDVVIPIARGLAATAGTSRTAGKRTFYAGLRLP